MDLRKEINYKILSRDEIEIDIKQIFKVCLNKLWFVCLCAVLCAIALSLFKYASDMKSYNDNLKGSLDNEIVLTEEEMFLVDKYILFEGRIEKLEEKKENSIFLQLDSANVNQGRLQCYVNANEDKQFDIVNALIYYAAHKIPKDLSKIEGYPDEEHIKDIISISYMESGNETSNLIHIRVLGDSDDMCRKYITDIKKLLNEYSGNIEDSMKNHTLHFVYEDYMATESEDLYNAQEYYYEKYNAAKQKLESTRAALSDKQRAYLSELKNPTTEDNNMAKPVVSIKFVIIGAILGFAIGIVLVCGMYLFDGKLHSEEELRHRFDINNLGAISPKNVEKGTDIGLMVSLMLKEIGQNSILFISTRNFAGNDAFCKLVEVLKSNGFKCETAENIIINKNSLEKLTLDTKVIIVEELTKSKVNDIYEMALLSDYVKADVFGYITITE